MRRKPTKRITSMILLLAATAFMLFGCAEEPLPEEAAAADSSGESLTTSIDVSVSFPQSELGKLLTAVGTVEDIVSVKIAVRLEADGSIVSPEVELVETPTGSGTWKGTIFNLPLFESLIFEANAYNDEGNAIFRDTITKELSDGATIGVVLEMEAVDDGIDPENPRIVSLAVPSEILANSVNNPLVFKFAHTATVQYSLAAERGTITSPTAGSHDPTFDMEVGYDAPDTAGPDTIRISIWDPEMTDTISTEYTVNIVEGQADAGITILFGPAITAMHFLRTENSLQISSETVPATGLLYQWEGSGSFAAFTATENPVNIDNFSDSDSGVIKLTVTDENGIQTSITRSIAPGDFPYMVLVSEEPSPNNTTLDIASLLLWQDEASHPFLPHEDAISFCQNDYQAGGYSDWRLPTRKELKGLYLRRNILKHILPYSYWTSELSSRSPSKAWYRAFGWGFESIKSRTHFSFVRCVRDWQE